MTMNAKIKLYCTKFAKGRKMHFKKRAKMYVHKIPLLISYILKIIIHTCYYYTLNETIQRSIVFVSDCMHLTIRGHARLCTITQCEVANFCYKLVLCGATYFYYMQKKIILFVKKTKIKTRKTKTNLHKKNKWEECWKQRKETYIRRKMPSKKGLYKKIKKEKERKIKGKK